MLVFLATALLLLFLYFKWAFGYWQRRGVPFATPSIPFGSSENPLGRTEYIGVRVKKRYDDFKARGCKHGGLFVFTSPIYMPVDPEYVKNVMAKDFRHFANRGVYYNEKDDPLSGQLFNLEGQKWRSLRSKLTPTFTSGKMKMMFPVLLGCCQELREAMEGYCREDQPVEVKDVLGCFTTDVIGSCAFGLECSSFKDPDNAFRTHGKKFFASTTRARSLGDILAMVNPALARHLGVKVIPEDVTRFFTGVVRETARYRREAKCAKSDFMQLLLEMEEKRELRPEEVAAQAFAFFLAGFETSSTTMSFCLFELAVGRELQEKVRGEVLEVLHRHQGRLSYESLPEFRYLGRVIDETLRKYPPASIIPRICVEDYHIPESGVTIEKGTRVLIPVFGLHHDPDFYPNPERFDPDRFSEERRGQRHPFTYLPFGEGPRVCIGQRFGLMQTKVGLISLLRDFDFSLVEKTKVPLEIDPTNLVLTSRDGIWLKVKKLK